MNINGSFGYRPTMYRCGSNNNNNSTNGSSTNNNHCDNKKEVKGKPDSDIQILVDACYMKFMKSLNKE